MTDSSDANSSPTDASVPTLAEVFMRFRTPESRRQLEQFRIAFEREHGKTDLTRYYTCFWPEDRQQNLVDYDFDAYMNGLPPFLQAFLDRRSEQAASEGALDKVDHLLIERHIRLRRRGGDGRSGNER